jgi:prephenate dehydratase
MTVAFQGQPGAYSEQAIYEHLGPVDTMPCETFDDAFAAVAAGSVDVALIPIENSLAGSVHQNYDLLLRHNLAIIGEYFLRVRHCLIAAPGVVKADIRRVISHPQALGQTVGYVRAMQGVTSDPVFDTAGSVRMLKESGDRTTAAVASRRAAELHGMSILEEGIEDDPENYTRFLVIAPRRVVPEADAKTSVVFSLKNIPGSLFKAMSVFALRDIDLTKIESRPLVGKPWEYLFYVDFLGSTEDPHVKRALDHLAEYALTLRVLGCYPRCKL